MRTMNFDREHLLERTPINQSPVKAQRASVSREKVQLTVHVAIHFMFGEFWRKMKWNEPGKQRLEKEEFLTVGKACMAVF